MTAANISSTDEDFYSYSNFVGRTADTTRAHFAENRPAAVSVRSPRCSPVQFSSGTGRECSRRARVIILFSGVFIFFFYFFSSVTFFTFFSVKVRFVAVNGGGGGGGGDGGDSGPVHGRSR